MLILALVFLASGAGCYFIGSAAASAQLMIACAVLCNLLTVAGIAIFLFELMIAPWRKQGVEYNLVDVALDVYRKLK